MNERVRAAEGQCELIALAEAAAEPELVTPTRSIILHVPGLAVQKQGSASSPMSPTKRRELDLWLCTDVLLLGELRCPMMTAVVCGAGVPRLSLSLRPSF